MVARRRQPRRHGDGRGSTTCRPPMPTRRPRDRTPRRPPGYSEWAGAGAGRREDGDYNLEAFVVRRDHPRRSPGGATGAGGGRSGAAHDRSVSHRHGRRGRLPRGRPRAGRREARRVAIRSRSRARRSCRASIPPGVCARNLTECLAIQLRERDRFDPAMQALVGHLDLLARRDLAALRKICGVERRRSDRHDRGDPPAQSEARPGVRLDAGAADRAGRVRAARVRTAAG